MNKTKRLFTMCLVLVSTIVGAWAQDEAKQQLVVWQRDGQKVRFDLSEEPRTTFSKGQMIIKTNRDSVSYQLSDVLRYTYEGPYTEISAAPTHDLTFSQTAEGTELRNVASGTVVRLYNTAGVLLESKTSDGSPVRFSLSSRPAGVYIINLDDRSFKISKR